MPPCLPQLTEPQLASLAKIACGLEAGSGTVLLCGPSGVGKTTVLEYLVAELHSTGKTSMIRDVPGWLAAKDAFPEVVLVDDAHAATEAELIRLLARCQARDPAAPLVLAGQGRLLTLVARDRRLEQATRLTASLLPSNLSATVSLLDACGGPRFDDDAVLTIHEITAGIPADILRLADLARIIAPSDTDGHVTADDVEMVHRRLSPRAA